MNRRSGRSAAVLRVLVMCVLIAYEGTAALCAERRKRDIMFPIYNEPPSFYHSHRHHHAHTFGPHVDMTPSQISGGLMTKLNEVDSIEDFMNLVVNMPNITDDGIGNRFGTTGDDYNGNVDRNSVPKKAQFAKCIPETVTVPLHINLTNPSEMYFPTCIRVNRCGGCCPTTLLSCQPTKSETLNLNVVVTRLEPGSITMNFQRMEMVPVEQHISCKCGCKLKAKHCNLTQVYKKNECRCECTNKDEMQKCLAENDTKVWDYNSCLCICRDPRECTTGFFYNPRTCRCMEIPTTKRRTSELDKRRRRGDTEQPWFQPRPVRPLPLVDSDESK